MASDDPSRARAVDLMYRLATEPTFLISFRRDPAGVARQCDLPELADDLAAPRRKATETLEGLDSRTSLAGLFMAVAAGTVGVVELLQHHQGGGPVGDVAAVVLDRHQHRLAGSKETPADVASGGGGTGPALHQGHVVPVHEPLLPPGTGAEANHPGEAAQALLSNPHISISLDARTVIQSGQVEPKLIHLLSQLAKRHEIGIAGTGPSSVDIVSVDGSPVTASNLAAKDVIQDLADLRGHLRPESYSSPWSKGGDPSGDRIHIVLGIADHPRQSNAADVAQLRGQGSDTTHHQTGGASLLADQRAPSQQAARPAPVVSAEDMTGRNAGGALPEAAASGGGASAYDLYARAGSVVRSPVDGTVIEVHSVGGSETAEGSVKIMAGDGRVWVFRHLDPRGVAEGQRVGAGQQIGAVAEGVGGQVMGPSGNGVAASDVIQIAKAQIGDKYLWGSEGPKDFDCSGLVYYSLTKAGIHLPVRYTANDFMMNTESVAGRDLKPGDLIFYNYKGTNPGHSDHVAIYLGNGKQIAASSSDHQVEVQNVDWHHFIRGGHVKGVDVGQGASTVQVDGGRPHVRIELWKSLAGGERPANMEDPIPQLEQAYKGGAVGSGGPDAAAMSRAGSRGSAAFAAVPPTGSASDGSAKAAVPPTGSASDGSVVAAVPPTGSATHHPPQDPPSAGGDQSSGHSQGGLVGQGLDFSGAHNEDQLMPYATTAAARLGLAGWEKDPALWSLIMHESGGRTTAQNPSSSAYGLFQMIDSTWAGTGYKKSPNPTEQFLAGMTYIKHSYGNPKNAWAFWQATAQRNPSLAPLSLRAKAKDWISHGWAGY
jgi:hypothetical protein